MTEYAEVWVLNYSCRPRWRDYKPERRLRGRYYIMNDSGTTHAVQWQEGEEGFEHYRDRIVHEMVEHSVSVSK